MAGEVAGVDAQVAAADLCAALDLIGRPVAPSISARLGLGDGPALSSDGLEALTRAGLLQRPEAEASALTPEFAAAARVLIDPRTELTIRLWTPAHEFETRIQFPGAIADGGGVSLNETGDRLRLKAYVGPGDALGLAHLGFVEAVKEATADSFEALFRAPVAHLFFAAIDFLRARAIVAGQAAGDDAGRDTAAFDPEHLGRFLALSAESPADARSLATYAALATGHRPALTEAELSDGLEELAAAGLLAAESAGYRPAGAVHELSHPAVGVTAALHWRRVSLLEGGRLGLSNRVVVRIGATLLLTLDSCDDGELLVRTTDAPGLAVYLENEVLDRPALFVRRAIDDAASAHPFCTKCGKKRRPGDPFCTGCGTKAR